MITTVIHIESGGDVQITRDGGWLKLIVKPDGGSDLIQIVVSPTLSPELHARLSVLHAETAPGDQTGDGTKPEMSHTQIVGDHRE